MGLWVSVRIALISMAASIVCGAGVGLALTARQARWRIIVPQTLRQLVPLTANGLNPHTDGSLTFHDQQLGSATEWEELRQKIGMVFQSYELFSHLSVLDNLLIAPKIVRGTKPIDAARAWLERVGLADKADALPRQLSGGQKQRVAIVRALLMNPEVLLLDEITASLDPEMVTEVLHVVKELADDGMTMLIVTHEMGFARAIADRILFLDKGRVVEESADPEAFFEAPRSPRAREFLDTFRYR